MKGAQTLFSSAKTHTGRDDWGTPRATFARYDAIYHFDIDAAANATNHLCDIWFGPGSPFDEDALTATWGEAPWGPHAAPYMVWCNPPYSITKPFMEKAHAEALAGRATTVALVAARTDVRWFHALAYDAATGQPRPGVAIVFLKGRQRFRDPVRRFTLETVELTPGYWDVIPVPAPSRDENAPFPSMIVIFRAGEVA